MAPLILGTKWKWMVNFASPPFYFRESSPLPVGQEGGWANSRAGHFGEEKNYLTVPKFEPRTVKSVQN
jgi:hypothetical protein